MPWRVTEVGGVNQVVLNLYRQFELAGTRTPRIGVNSWVHKHPLLAREDDRSVAYMRVRAPIATASESRGPLAWTGAWVAQFLPEAMRLARFLRANDIACVNVHYVSLAALQFVLVRRLFLSRIKIVLSFHGLDLAQARRSAGIERRLWKILLQRSDAVVNCSNAQTRLFRDFASGTCAPAVTIHNGIDIDGLMDARNPAARIDTRLHQRRFVLSVARYEPKKGLDTLLRAFGAVREEHGVDVMLALVGPDCGIERDLRRLAERLGIAETVVFCGEVPHRDLHAYYCAADVFCLASRAEPFGIVLLEAGAFRCPVVATRVGGIPEILEHDVNARLVPPDDPAALAAALAMLLRERDAAARLAGALHDHVTANFSWRRAHGSYAKLVERLGADAADLSRTSSSEVTTSRE